MTFDLWVEKYEKKTKEKFKPHSGFKLFYLPDRGFCEIKIDSDNKIIMIYQLCGDGMFWRDYGLLLGKLTGCTVLGTVFCRENVKAFIKLLNFKITKEVFLKDGLKRFICLEKNTFKKGIASPVITENKIIYYMTMEV